MLERKKKVKALLAPESKTTIITTSHIDLVVTASRENDRKRMILPFHKNDESTLHRMLNGIQPMSYIRPHRHLQPPKAESLIVLQGTLLCYIFQPAGEIAEIHKLVGGSENFGIDCEPGVYHTFIALEQDTVLFEVKPGPYSANNDKDFAPWAPKENTQEATNYLRHLLGKTT